jgi:hypothetical protein
LLRLKKRSRFEYYLIIILSLCDDCGRNPK